MRSGEFSFEGVGGVKIVGNLFPPAEASRIRQVVLYHHGLWADILFPPFQPLLIHALEAPERLVFAYDARGHGRSCYDSVTGRFGDYFDVEAMVTDVTLALNFVFAKFGLIDRRDVEVILIGHSLGGYVSLRAAAEDPRVSRVVTISAPVSLAFRKHRDAIRFFEKLLVDLPQRIHDGLGDKKPLSIYRLHTADLRAAERNFVSARPVSEVAERIRCPVSFLIGKRDVLIEPFDTRRLTKDLAAKIPGAKVAFIPGDHGFFGVEGGVVKAVLSEIGPKKSK